MMFGCVVICYSNGWVDIWSTPKASVDITYKYHPIPPTGRDVDEFSGTPDGEETILIPVLVAQRPLRPRTQCRDSVGYLGAKEFDPTTLSPDNIDVKISIGASVCYAYGSLVCNFLNLKVHVKANFFHDDVQFRSNCYCHHNYCAQSERHEVENFLSKQYLAIRDLV